jgi:hypothetical protein
VLSIFEIESCKLFGWAGFELQSQPNQRLYYKASLSKYKKIVILPCILFDHNAIKLELNNKNKDNPPNLCLLSS